MKRRNGFLLLADELKKMSEKKKKVDEMIKVYEDIKEETPEIADTLVNSIEGVIEHIQSKNALLEIHNGMINENERNIDWLKQKVLKQDERMDAMMEIYKGLKKETAGKKKFYRKRRENEHKRWSDVEDDILRKFIKQDKTIEEIAKALRRTPFAIVCRGLKILKGTNKVLLIEKVNDYERREYEN